MDNGGLNMVDFNMVVKSLKAAWVKQLCEGMVANGALSFPRLHPSMEDELFSIVILTHVI